jgi:rRNA maturation protein Nop10
MLDAIKRAREVAGVDDEAHLPLGRRYSLRCPECGDAVRRAEPKLRRHFNLLWGQGIYRISLDGLRELDKLV